MCKEIKNKNKNKIIEKIKLIKLKLPKNLMK